MEITAREAAVLLGRSIRTVRDQAARGALPARKDGRDWKIRIEHLPLTESQRAALQARAAMVRDVVDQALPPRDAATPGETRRTLADLDAFRSLKVLHDELSGQPAAATETEAALLALGEAVHHWDRDTKLAAVERARAAIGRAEVRLRLAGVDPATPAFARLLSQVAPALAGYGRWVSTLGRRG
ncbi:MAG TPA: helix-turn-helix domain-containing protein [Myxococcota bacterium]|nr:helix-turn-helix domain-containing protein [Myxococcota bacterium]